MSGPLEFLIQLQREFGGAIPAERYFQEALYHPEFGYYSRNIRTVGRRGDFATAATLGEALGNGIAHWLAANRLPGSKWHVIEAGAGNGELARTVLRRLGIWRRRGLTYHIVESSPVLQAEQQRAIPQYHVQWHRDMNEALAAGEGRALIFSNELIDAFPARVFEFDGRDWHEIAVRINDKSVSECVIDRPRPQSTAFEIPASAGQRVEVQTTAAEWIATWSEAVHDARLLTIDYGDTVPGLYHRRPQGTVRAYFHHQRFDGPAVYQRFGKQDITCDVNFSDLRAWTERLGWKTDFLSTQTDFLKVHGGMRSTGLHDAQLAGHSGAGEAFKVLIQSRGSGGPTTGSPSLPRS